MKLKFKILLAVFLLLIPAVILISYNRKGSDGKTAAGSQTVAKKYHCPMHPNYTSDKPGDCPICGMKLVPVEEPAQAQAKEKKVAYYRNPMDPKVTSPVPMKDSMGMDYVPVYEDETANAGTDLYISPERQQLIGVKFSEVARRNLELFIRASGTIAHDTELYSAIGEYQQAYAAAKKRKAVNAEESVSQEASDEDDSLLASTIERLRHLGVSDKQMEEYANSQRPPESLIRSGHGGGSVWVYAQIYESEIGLVKEGQLMEVTSMSLPGKKFTGKVSSVDPYLNNETRSLRARAEVADPEGQLRPDMFVDTIIHVSLGNKIAVPEEAVLDTGTRQIVFVKKDNGRFEPRRVQVGRQAEGYYEILSGVSVGEEVVTTANFLIDSETKMKAAISGL